MIFFPADNAGKNYIRADIIRPETDGLMFNI